MKRRQIEWSRGNRNFHKLMRPWNSRKQQYTRQRSRCFLGCRSVRAKWLKFMDERPGEPVQGSCRGYSRPVQGTSHHWDVNNEMLHGDYFDRTIGNNIRAKMFQWTKEIDPEVKTFVNDYEVLSGGLTNCYKQQISELIEAGAPIDGIGVQSHFKRCRTER